MACSAVCWHSLDWHCTSHSSPHVDSSSRDRRCLAPALPLWQEALAGHVTGRVRAAPAWHHLERIARLVAIDRVIQPPIPFKVAAACLLKRFAHPAVWGDVNIAEHCPSARSRVRPFHNVHTCAAFATGWRATCGLREINRRCKSPGAIIRRERVSPVA